MVQLVAERISRPFASGTARGWPVWKLASPRLSRECRLPPSHLSSHGRITASPFPVLLEVEALLVPRARMPGVDLRIGGMLLNAVFRPFQGVGPADEDDRLVAREPAHLVGRHEVALDHVVVLGRGAVRAPRIAFREHLHGLLADHLRYHLVGLGGLAAQEHHGVAAVKDGLRAFLLVGALELACRLQDDAEAHVARARRCDDPLEIGHRADVSELVEQEVHGPLERAPEASERRLVQDARRLPHEEREEEVEGRVGIRHAREDGVPALARAERVEGHLVVGDQLRNRIDRERLEAHVAADDDRFQRLSRRHLEGAVVREREVLFGAAGLADADPSPVASVVEGAFPLRALPAPPLHEAHARLELLEDKVQRAHVGLVLFARLGKAQKQHERVEVPFLGSGVVHEIRHERRVEQALRVLPERVGALAVLGGGVLDQAFDEDEDVRLVAHVGERVVVHRAREIGGVEGPDVVAGVLEGPPDLAQKRALGVRHEEVGVLLHYVRLDVVARLARAGTAENAYVAVAVVLEVEALRLEGKSEVPREKDVVGGILPVHERAPLLECSPAGRTVFLSLSVRARAHESACPDRPGDAGCHEPHGKRHGL